MSIEMYEWEVERTRSNQASPRSFRQNTRQLAFVAITHVGLQASGSQFDASEDKVVRTAGPLYIPSIRT